MTRAPQPPPQQPYGEHPPPPPKWRRKPSKLVIVLASVGGLVALCCGGTIIAAIAGGDDKPKGKSIAAPTTTTPAVVVTTTAAAVATTEPAYAAPAPHEPTPKDFTIKVKTLEKKCFGSAGCNVEYRIQPEYSGPPLGSDQTTEVTYEVRGLEDTAVGTFTMNGTSAEIPSSESGSTTSSGKKLTAKVTSVESM